MGWPRAGRNPKIVADAHENIFTAGYCVLALRRGDQTAHAHAGAMLVGEFMVSVIALVRALAAKGK